MGYRLTIETRKADVIAEVNKTCAYMGARTMETEDGKRLYGHISTSKEDAEMLERYWREACTTVAATGKEYVAATDYEDDAFTIGYALSDSYNKAMDGSVRQSVFSFIVEYILSKWLDTCGLAEMAKLHGDVALLTEKQLDVFLYARTLTRNAKAEDAGGNTLGDLVDSYDAGDDDGDDEDAGKNVIGDLVDSYGGDGTDNDEDAGKNTYGDLVDSFGDGEDGDGEDAGSNEYGGTLPQNWGETKVEHYVWR